MYTASFRACQRRQENRECKESETDHRVQRHSRRELLRKLEIGETRAALGINEDVAHANIVVHPAVLMYTTETC